MELWMWMIGGGLAVGGFLWGMFLGRSGAKESDESKAKARGLETELSAVRQDFQQYREEVTNHFRTTADLIHQMTATYKSVYEHLSSGSQRLCSGEVMLELDESPRLPKSTAGGPGGNGSAGGGHGGSSSDETESSGGVGASSHSAREGEAGRFMH